MRVIEDFKINPVNDALVLRVVDQPGPGGASHRYEVVLPDGAITEIAFQKGPINEAGINGLTHEVLLSIITDRLRAFQAGPFASRENALALTKIEEAQHWLQHRTRARMTRGVEGTMAA